MRFVCVCLCAYRNVLSLRLAAFVPALGLLGIAWAGCDRIAVMLLLSITSAFGGAVYAGKKHYRDMSYIRGDLNYTYNEMEEINCDQAMKVNVVARRTLWLVD